MQRLYILLPLLFAFYSLSTPATQLTPLYQQLQQQKHLLGQRLLPGESQPSAQSTQALTADYIYGQGVQFRIFADTRNLFNNLQPEQQADTSERNAQTQPARAGFNQLRQNARQLAHQSYSLERQIKSMQQALVNQTADEQRQTQWRINQSQQQLSQLQQQRAALQPDYLALQQPVMQLQANASQLTPAQNDPLIELLADYLCQSVTLLELLPEHESIAFIFYHTGIMLAQHEQSKIYNFPNKAITSCQHQQISTPQLIDRALSHYF